MRGTIDMIHAPFSLFSTTVKGLESARALRCANRPYKKDGRDGGVTGVGQQQRRGSALF